VDNGVEDGGGDNAHEGETACVQPRKKTKVTIADVLATPEQREQWAADARQQKAQPSSAFSPIVSVHPPTQRGELRHDTPRSREWTLRGSGR
jgi:hypothetical protein